MESVNEENNSRWARRALLGFAFLAPCLAFYLARTNLLVALAPIFLSHLLLLYATLRPNCQWWGPVMRSFKTSEPEVWLTIDDGPSPAHTVAMLDLLDRFQARATFFVIGTRAEKYPHLLTEILSRGHEIANHTYTHPSGNVLGGEPGPSRGRNRSLRGPVASRARSAPAFVSRAGGIEESVCPSGTRPARARLDRLDGSRTGYAAAQS